MATDENRIDESWRAAMRSLGIRRKRPPREGLLDRARVEHVLARHRDDLMRLPGVISSGVASMPVWREVKGFVVPDYVQGEQFVIALGIAHGRDLPEGPMYVDDVPIVVYNRGVPRRVWV